VRSVTYGAGYKLERDAGTLELQLFGADNLFRQDRARVTPDRSSASLASSQRTPSSNQGGVATYTTQLGTRHAILTGVDGRRVVGTATDALSPPMIEASTLVERSAGGEQRFAGAFIEDAISVTDAIDLAAVVRVDGWQNRGGSLVLTRGNGERMERELDARSQLQLSPRLGILGRITPELAVRASGYRSFRAPTLNELYRPFQVGTVLTAANENLDAERLYGVEAGPQVMVSNIAVRATGFYNRMYDAIGNVTLPEPQNGAMRQRQNFGTARIAGVELEGTWRPSAAWTFMVAHTFMNGEVIAAPTAPMLVGRRLAQNPQHRATASVTYDSARLATITAQVRYLGTQFEDDLNTLPMGAVGLFDARLARRIGSRLVAFVSGQNLFDRRYLVGRAGVDTLGAPRTVEIGLILDTN
jgi:iron complex outermembrane recepter protein